MYCSCSLRSLYCNHLIKINSSLLFCHCTFVILVVVIVVVDDGASSGCGGGGGGGSGGSNGGGVIIPAIAVKDFAIIVTIFRTNSKSSYTFFTNLILLIP